jgi:hypothetical protein
MAKKEMMLTWLYIAEVVGSTPTRSISFYEGTTALNDAYSKELSDKFNSNMKSLYFY